MGHENKPTIICYLPQKVLWLKSNLLSFYAVTLAGIRGLPHLS
jgi:hypothetical protein